MRFLLVTDTHLGIYQSSDLYHDVVYNLFKEIVEYSHQNGIDTIIHLGDFFHERRVLNTKTQSIAHKIAELFNDKLCMYILLGNHDCYYKTNLEPTTLEIFRKYTHIHIVKEETHLNDVILLPYSILPKKKTGYIFGHLEFKGFKMNTNFICEYGLDPIHWKGFKHIYSGHFHWPSSKGNITYLGSSYPHNFNDVDSPRGYYIWEDGELDFIEYKYAPKYVKLYTNDINKDKVKNNIIKLIFTEDYGSIKNQKIIDDVLLLGPKKLQPDFSQIKLEGTDDVIETTDASLLDHREILTEYINKTEIPNHMNKKTVLSMIEKLRGEILNE